MMEQILAWGLDVIRAVQSVLSDGFINFTKVVTLVGGPVFYFPIVPLLIWCFDYKKGFRLSLTFFAATSFNTILKDIFRIPRPYQVDSSVYKVSESGYSTPSGHAQLSATFWGTGVPLFGQRLKKWVRVLIVVLLPLIIGLTRPILGVHYPSDIILGWLVGAGFTAAFWFLWKPVSEKLITLPCSVQILIAALITFLLNYICEDSIIWNAALFGLATGYILMEKNPFNAKSGAWWKKLLRYIIGMVLIFLVYIGLKTVFPKDGSSFYAIFRFIRYFLLGFVGTFIAPKLFLLMRLADKK